MIPRIGENMKFNVDTHDIQKLKTDCIIVGVYENAEFTASANQLNQLSQGYIKDLLNYGEFHGKVSQTFLVYDVPKVNIPRILLVGCGKKGALTPRDFRKIIFSSFRALSTLKTHQLVSFLTELDVRERDISWKIKQAVEACHEALYVFDQFKSSKEPKTSLQDTTFFVTKDEFGLAEIALKQAVAVGNAVDFVKNIANLPSNICTPTYLAKEAELLQKKYSKITVKVLEKADMQKLGMGAFLAVAKGSAENPKLICLEYKGTSKKQAPIAFVGKGITFDTGGLSLKPADGMVGMKYDMCGAATVLGVLKAAADLKLPLNIVGIMAVAENMPSGTATKPEDIVTTLSGQTIEILNTDAEGRLVLSDALTYAERYKPEVVIDIATLTGAVVIALGYHATGLLANDDTLAKQLIEAGIESHDRVWQMPLWDEYQEQLKSPFADMANVGGRVAGVITASCFLSRFTKKFRWAHLDVAGTAAMMSGTERYATGRPVPLLVQYLMNQCASRPLTPKLRRSAIKS